MGYLIRHALADDCVAEFSLSREGSEAAETIAQGFVNCSCV